MLDFILKHNHELQFAATFGGILILVLLEPFLARRKNGADQAGRWTNNIGLALFNFYAIAYFSIAYVNTGIGEIVAPAIPLFEYLAMSTAVSIAVTILTFELLGYWIHRLMHRVPFLWHIHAVHHNDIDIDVTTANRHHPFEGMIFTLVAFPLMLLMGVPVVAAITYNAVRLLISLLTHANIRLPETLDSILRPFIVTPDFHRMHHSSDKQYTDSNYGVITPWFDYLFGTATRLPYSDIPGMELGLHHMRKPGDSRIDRLLLLPFVWKKATLRS